MTFGGSANSRARLLFAVLLGGLVLLIGRTGYLQVFRGEELAEQARRQHYRSITLPAARGRILDRHGRLLASTYHARSVAVDPQMVDDPATFAARVAFLLDEPAAGPAFSARIRAARAEGRRFVYLRRWLDRGTTDRLARSGLPGLDLREEPRRAYPHGTAAAAVVGMVGPDGDGETTGRTGLEYHCDARLRGEPGACFVFRGGRANDLYHLFPSHNVEPVPGSDLRTTLDVAIQQIAEEALADLQEKFAPKSCCAVVLDPRNGEVLALAGAPALDPAEFPRVDPERLRIPGVHTVYEPGSTIKPLIMAWALTRGVVHPGQEIDCGPGHMRFGGRLLHDVKPRGVLDLEHVLIKSSNIGMAQVGRAIGIDAMEPYLRVLGFGRRTGLQLSGEETGALTPRSKWHEDYTLVSVSMGHEILVTPLQLAAAYASLLNGGRIVRPTLLRDAPRPPDERLPLSRDALAFVKNVMVRVVGDPGGTGRRAKVDGVAVGGKTGTAEKYNGEGKNFSSFVGFAPAHDPRMVVLVMADEPQARDGLRPYGGVVAAPAARKIFQRGLPIVHAYENSPLSESGVRRNQALAEKVRVAAVNRSSVNAGVRMAPARGRNPDSAGGEECRSAR